MYYFFNIINKAIHPLDAIKKAQDASLRRFDESVDIDIILGVDPRKPGQNIRCNADVYIYLLKQLPFGTGKKIAICAFGPIDMKDKIIEKGAIFGDELVVEEIKKGNINFTKCLATPPSMKLLKPIARILGPKGLMPNQKSGTLGKDILELIDVLFKILQKAKLGSIELRCDKAGIIHCSIGKVSFPYDHLVGNFKSVIVLIIYF